jgi:NAD(P) transhydrogenase subunit alpha
VDKNSGTVSMDWDDELVTGTALTRDGRVVHPLLAPDSDEAGDEAGDETDQAGDS